MTNLIFSHPSNAIRAWDLGHVRRRDPAGSLLFLFLPFSGGSLFTPSWRQQLLCVWWERQREQGQRCLLSWLLLRFSDGSRSFFAPHWQALRALSMVDSPLCGPLLVGTLSVFLGSSSGAFQLQRWNSSWQFLTLPQMLPEEFTHSLLIFSSSSCTTQSLMGLPERWVKIIFYSVHLTSWKLVHLCKDSWRNRLLCRCTPSSTFSLFLPLSLNALFSYLSRNQANQQ